MNPNAFAKYPSIQRFGLHTAILLILGVLLPVIAPTSSGMEILFPNFLVLDIPMIPIPTSVKLYALFPLLGGIICLVALFLKNHIARAILYLLVGFTPYFLSLVITNDIWDLFNGLPGGRGMAPEMPTLSFQLSYLMPIALMALIVAAFVGSNDRQNKVAPNIALGGGILMLLMLIIPVDAGGETGSVSLISIPFRAFEEDFATALIVLTFLVLMVAACLLGIVWGARHKVGVNHALRIKYLLRIAFWELLVFGMLLMLVRMEDDVLQVFFVAILIVVKVVGMFVAPFYAKCLGFIEVLTYVGGQAPSPQVAGDMGPFSPVKLPETGGELPFGPDSGSSVEKDVQ